MAVWPSGKAVDCKSTIPGSNLGGASFFSSRLVHQPDERKRSRVLFGGPRGFRIPSQRSVREREMREREYCEPSRDLRAAERDRGQGTATSVPRGLRTCRQSPGSSRRRDVVKPPSPSESFGSPLGATAPQRTASRSSDPSSDRCRSSKCCS